MSKWASFATGMGEGYLAGKRYKDTKKERDEDRQMMKDILMSRNSDSADSGMMGFEMDDETAEMTGLRRKKPVGMPMANGGMVGEMPKHHDKMSWQRGSFKK
jgi:hypothetical protein